MQLITPFLWFDNNAEEAMNFMSPSLRTPGSVESHAMAKLVPVPLAPS